MAEYSQAKYSQIFYARNAVAVSGSISATSSTSVIVTEKIQVSSSVSATSVLNPYALSFDGLTNYVNVPNSPSLQVVGSQTIEMWLKPASFSSRKNPFNKAYGGEGTITQETNGVLDYYYGTSGGNASPYQGFGSGKALALNEWTHVALVRDLTNMTLHWYFNGVQVSSAVAAYSSATASSYPVIIGNGYTTHYDGLIDRVRVWNVARTQAEIQASMNSRLIGNETGLVADWEFDEGTGTVAYDRTNNNNDGTLYGPTWTNDTPGDVIPQMSISSAASISANSSLSGSGTGNFAVAATISTFSDVQDGEKTVTSVTENDGPWVSQDVFYNGSLYKYVVVSSTAPTVSGGSNVSITDEGSANGTIGNQTPSYLITSNTPVSSITAGSITQSNFNIRSGDIFWYGVWWNSGSAQIIPTGYDIAFAIGRTEDLGTSTWEALLDGNAIIFSQNVTDHYFVAPISNSTTHTIQITYVSGGKGIQFSFWGYAKAIKSSVTMASSGSIRAISNVNGIISGNFGVSSIISGTSSLSANINANFAESGSVSGTSYISANATGTFAASGGIVGISNITVSVTENDRLSGSVVAGSTLQANAIGTYAASASFSTSSSISATITGSYTVSSSITGNSSISGQITGQYSLDTNGIQARSLMTVNESMNVSLTSSISANSSITDTITGTLAASGSITCVSSLSGSVTQSDLLSSSIQTVSTLSGSLTGDYEISGSIINQPIYGIKQYGQITYASSSNFQGDISVLLVSSVSISTDSSITGAAGVLYPGSANITASSSFNVTETMNDQLTSSINAASSLSGTLTGTFSLSAQNIQAASNITGNAFVAMDPSGMLESISSMSGTITRTFAATGSMQTVSSFNEVVTNNIALSGSISGMSDLSGNGEEIQSIPISGTFIYEDNLQGEFVSNVLVKGSETINQVIAAVFDSSVSIASQQITSTNINSSFISTVQFNSMFNTSVQAAAVFITDVSIMGAVLISNTLSSQYSSIFNKAGSFDPALKIAS